MFKIGSIETAHQVGFLVAISSQVGNKPGGLHHFLYSVVSLVARRKSYRLLFNVLIDRLPGLFIFPSIGIQIPFFADDIFVMEEFHDVQIQDFKHPAGHIE